LASASSKKRSLRLEGLLDETQCREAAVITRSSARWNRQYTMGLGKGGGRSHSIPWRDRALFQKGGKTLTISWEEGGVVTAPRSAMMCPAPSKKKGTRLTKFWDGKFGIVVRRPAANLVRRALREAFGDGSSKSFVEGRVTRSRGNSLQRVVYS